MCKAGCVYLLLTILLSLKLMCLLAVAGESLEMK